MILSRIEKISLPRSIVQEGSMNNSSLPRPQNLSVILMKLIKTKRIN